MRALCFERMDVFWQIIGMRVLFTGWTVFLQKMAKRWEDQFFHEKSKKRASYWLFWPIVEYSFNRVGVFLNNHLHDKRGFFMKSLKKNVIRAPYFWEIRYFLTKYGHERCAFHRLHSFSTKNGQEMKGSIFSWKIGKKKGVLLTLLAYSRV